MRCENLSSFIVMDILRDMSKFDDAIHFEIGQPDLPPSLKVKNALKKAIDENRFAYTESLGLFELREKIANMYLANYNVKVNPNQIFLTPGTSGAFLIAYFLTLRDGAKLGLSDPSYPCYKNFAYLLNIEPIFIPIAKEDNFELNIDKLKGRELNAIQDIFPHQIQ